MPTYQYVCTNPECGNEFELVQSFTDPAAQECPVCGQPVRKRFGSVGVVFKGSGFYRTDSRAEAKSGSGAKTASANGSGDSSAKSDGAKSDSAKSDSAKSGSGGSDGAKSGSGKPAGSSGSAPASTGSGSGSSGSSGSGRVAASA